MEKFKAKIFSVAIFCIYGKISVLQRKMFITLAPGLAIEKNKNHNRNVAGSTHIRIEFRSKTKFYSNFDVGGINASLSSYGFI